MTYWIVVGTPENFEIAVKRKFDLVGFKSTRRSESGQMQVGDKLIFYLTGLKQFGGLATVTSEAYEEHTKIFASEKKAGEDFPFRVKTRPEIVLKEGQRLHVPAFVPLLEKTKKGTMKSWGMAFQGNLHRISDHDFKLLERAMRAAAKGKAKPATAVKSAAAKDASASAPKRAGPKPTTRKATTPKRTAPKATARKSTTRKAAAKR